jgi:hypothetical protein
MTTLSWPQQNTSPISLADRMLTLAQEAERAGMVLAADRLVELAYAVLDCGIAPIVTH